MMIFWPEMNQVEYKKIIYNVLLYYKNDIINSETFTFQQLKSQSVFFYKIIRKPKSIIKIGFNVKLLQREAVG